MALKRLICSFLLLSFLAFSNSTLSISLGTRTSAGTTSSYFPTPIITPHKHTLQVVVTGTPAACTVRLEGTLDDPGTGSPNWFDLSGTQTCTSTIMFHVVDKPVRAVRANVLTLSGGTSPTVTMKYAGVE